MKNILFPLLFCLHISVLWAQRAPDTHASLYPVATQYATRLYVSNATERTGSIQQYAAHLVLKGSGQLGWEKEITGKGEYEVVLAYSVRKEGASVKVICEKDTLADAMHSTEGVYAENKFWYQFNCERKLLSGRLNLSQGLHSIVLQVITPDEDFETIVYILELIPVAKKPAIIKEAMHAEKARPQMDWFSSMKYGVMFHWTSQSVPRTGSPKNYQDAVKDFDVNAFVDMVMKTGADYVIFTANHADPHFPAPLKEWKKIHPGWTTERDLISEIAEGLREKNIRMLLYFATHIYAKFDQVDSREFGQINYQLIAEVGKRYKDKIAGYWLDGWYQCYEKHPDFGFEQFYNICKAGNPDRLISLNSWLYPIVSVWQDYWAGEVYSPAIPPSKRKIETGPGTGLQFHGLLALEGDWVHTKQNTKIVSPVIETSDLMRYISSCLGKGPVTINILIYQDGTISDEALAVMDTIKQKFKNTY